MPSCGTSPKRGQATAVATDVTKLADVRKLVDTAKETYGRVDVIFNNAGLMPLSPLDSLRIDEWDRMIDVNMKGTLYGIAAALPYMKAQKSGHVINVSSVYGHKVVATGAVYCATKHAVRAISEGLRQEVKDYNIRVTTLSPGAVRTELTDHITEPDWRKASATWWPRSACRPAPWPAWSPSRFLSRMTWT